MENIEKEKCGIEGCENVVFRKGLCGKHYREGHKRTNKKCSVEGCDDFVHARELCEKHYNQFYKQKRRESKETNKGKVPLPQIPILNTENFTTDLFDFATFKKYEQEFLKVRLKKYIESEEYDLSDPVVEYQLYSILIEELEIRELRLKILKGDKKEYKITNFERQLDSAHKRLRDLWGDLNALIRQKLPDGSKKLSIAEQIKELEEKKKEVREQKPEKEKMKKVLKKRIEEEDI